jgi:uncharacterized protein YdeI (YjbR/CyaY-like superfamily)
VSDIQFFASQHDWHKWLGEYYATSTGLWLRIAKKAAPQASVTYADAIDVALCFGWIDGQKKPDDAQYWLQRFSPRRPKSIWSKINVAKVEGLIARGAMHEAGLLEVEKAKADGRWANAYAGSSTIQIPDYFQHALEKNSQAMEFFKTLNSQNRYAILFRLTTAKKIETQQKLTRQFVDMLGRGEKIYN